MATPANDSHGLQQLNDIAQVRFLLLAYSRIRGDGDNLFFKVQEEKNEWFIVDAKDTQLAQTDKETTLYFLLAYNLPKSRQDELGYQYFEISIEALTSAETHLGVGEALLIARNITSPPGRRK